VVNVVTLFQGFFQSFGALACFFAIVAARIGPDPAEDEPNL